MKTLKQSFFLLLLVFFVSSLTAQEDKNPKSIKDVSLSGLKFRSIGPAITGGRVIDIAVNPLNYHEYYIASGSGSLWKTTNNGITFTPSFENQNTYAIGDVEIDPINTNVLWVGTGENNNQNNSGYGDGIYKSEDGGNTWKNMGLKTSEHIGKIIIDPNNPDIVYVAAMGPLRKKGGERGIFKTTDGGKNWNKVLDVSQYTGFYEVHMDPRHSNILYAVAHQRMRKLYTGVSGGPESGIYKSTDSGVSWEKLSGRLPSGDVGRISMSVSPINPNVLFAIVEAKENQGVYRSADRGASWNKQSSYVSAYAFYFQEIYCDVADIDRVYSLDIFNKVSNDAGKTWENLGEDNKHVDNHALWINPGNNKHMISGCDGGVYVTYDQAKSWEFKSNIPIAEIYKIATDNAEPFYNVYIGTQDNNSLTGPSRTISSGGITNNDWTFTISGDGFQSQVDWKDPNIVYAQSQNGGLSRYDKKSGEKLFIKPYEFGDTAYRFDWDSPLLISKHDNKRLYFAGNKLFRTDDQGSTWKEISPDLTRGIPKHFQKLMGKSWSIDELVRKGSMANIVSIAESPLDENILYVGSGDGLIHSTKDGGKTWEAAKEIENIPPMARVHQIIASHFNKSIAFAACHNFHDGDYLPYLYKTTDGGKTWKLINGDLPELGSSYTIAQDHVNKDLLFAGTQFGVFISNNGGENWIKLKNGIPTICVMNLKIQERENDLVVSTYGRGVYILDDYSPLRNMTEENFAKDAYIFPIKDALMYVESTPFGFPGIGFLGANFYSAPNPKPGAVFTYYIKDEYKSLKKNRRDLEIEKQKKGEDIEFPSYESRKKEINELDAFLLFTITNESGEVVRKIKKEISKGVQQLVWDFRYNIFSPISFDSFDDSVPWNEPDKGYMVVPGRYKISLSKFENGVFTELVAPLEFVCKTLGNKSIPVSNRAALHDFNTKVAELTRTVMGADAHKKELDNKIKYLKKAVFESANVPMDIYNEVLAVESKLKTVNEKFNGDGLKASYEGAVPTSIKERVSLLTYGLWTTTSAPTTTYLKSYETAKNQFGEIFISLENLGKETEVIETKMKEYSAPYTPGRFPNLDNK
ncbi:MAG: glycosyl hydrolase [Melioribacteraceae bacterium]|nr:glycosyl hydrolase [Melioribacteraceae bacterium]